MLGNGLLEKLKGCTCCQLGCHKSGFGQLSSKCLISAVGIFHPMSEGGAQFHCTVRDPAHHLAQQADLGRLQAKWRLRVKEQVAPGVAHQARRLRWADTPDRGAMTRDEGMMKRPHLALRRGTAVGRRYENDVRGANAGVEHVQLQAHSKQHLVRQQLLAFGFWPWAP